MYASVLSAECSGQDVAQVRILVDFPVIRIIERAETSLQEGKQSSSYSPQCSPQCSPRYSPRCFPSFCSPTSLLLMEIFSLLLPGGPLTLFSTLYNNSNVGNISLEGGIVVEKTRRLVVARSTCLRTTSSAASMTERLPTACTTGTSTM